MKHFKLFVFFGLLLGWGTVLSATERIQEIDTANYKVLSVGSESADHGVDLAFDGDSATWWGLVSDAEHGFPCPLVIDFGSSRKLSGFSYLCNKDNTSERLSDYKVYVSDDTSRWGEVQAYSSLFWETSDDVTSKQVVWGAVQGRYLKLVYLSNTNTWNQSVQTAELRFFESPDAVEFKKNQYIIDDSTLNSDMPTTNDYELNVKASSGLEVLVEVVAGPATIDTQRVDGKLVQTLKFDGEEGTLTLKMVQQGNEEYYAVEKYKNIHVTNPDLYDIEIITSLIEEEEVVMPELLSYMLKARAEIGATLYNRIEEMQILVDDEELDAVFKDGYVYAKFEPQSFADYKVEFVASANNGKTQRLVRNIRVAKADSVNRVVRTMDNVLVNFPEPGRTNGGVYNLPQYQGAYKKIIAKLDVACPEIDGGCDDWDRVAWIEVQTPDGEWRELIRYITPYGKACKHSLDVTHFASILQGKLPIRMFIDTWGTGGWDITLDFEFYAGTPQYMYSKLTPLWNGNFPFGDYANLQPLDTLELALADNTSAAEVKIVTTGHGWGANNSQNAAEFYYANHKVIVNGEVFPQVLQTTCNPNPDSCLEQQGTWAFDRAGWCPGAISPGFTYNVNDFVREQKLILSYIFEEGYIDYCHPHHPDCVSGKTCKNCNDSYNPQYYIASYLVEYSKQMYDSVSNEVRTSKEEIRFSTYPNPATTEVFIQTYGECGRGDLQLIDMQGNVCKQYVFSNAAQLNALCIKVSDLPSGIYFVRIQTQTQHGLKKILVRR